MKRTVTSIGFDFKSLLISSIILVWLFV
ncbi:uncharacterized protein METZ01_LOCUS56037, partial [marine metagenome]